MKSFIFGENIMERPEFLLKEKVNTSVFAEAYDERFF